MTVQEPPQDPAALVTAEQVQEIVSNAIAAEREALEVRLVEQEHRGTRIVLNWYEALKGERKDLKRSAWLAMLWHFLIPRPTTIALAAGGVATLLITAFGVAMAYRANILLERQNARIDVQNLLSEAQRRATQLSSELSILLPLIHEEISLARAGRPAGSANAPFELPSPLAARIAALSAALRPYRIVDILPNRRDRTSDAPEGVAARVFGSLNSILKLDDIEPSMYGVSEEPYSPERGQLFLLMLALNVDLTKLSVDFSHSLIRGARLNGLKPDFVNLSNSRFQDTQITSGDFGAAIMDRAEFVDSKLFSVTIHRFSLLTMKLVNTTGVAIHISNEILATNIFQSVNKPSCQAIDLNISSFTDVFEITNVLSNCDVKSLQLQVSADVAKLLKVKLPNTLAICERIGASPELGLTVISNRYSCEPDFKKHMNP